MTLDTAKSKTEEAFQALAKSAIEKENSRKSVLSKNGDEAAVGTRRIEYEDNAKRVQLMVEAYESAKEGYDAFKAAQKDMIKQAAEYSREQKKKHRNRKKGGTVVLKNIKDAIAGKTRGQYYLDLYDGDLFNMDFDQRGYGRFEITIVDDILGPVVRAPTTATEEKIEAALTNLFQKFEVLNTNGFLDEDNDYHPLFFDETCPCESACVAYIAHVFPRCTDILKSKWCGLKKGFFEKIESNDLKEALYGIIHEGLNWGSGFRVSPLKTLFIRGVTLDILPPGSREDHHADMAEWVWKYNRNRDHWWNFSLFKTAFLRLKTDFRKYSER